MVRFLISLEVALSNLDEPRSDVTRKYECIFVLIIDQHDPHEILDIYY